MSGAVATAGGLVVRASEQAAGSADPDADVDQPAGAEAGAPADGERTGDGGGKGSGRDGLLRKAIPVLAVLAALLLLGGLVAAFTVDDGPSTSLPSSLLGEEPVESEQLSSAADLVTGPMTEAGVEDVTSRFYGGSAERPVVFVARGGVPEDAENPRAVLDAVERALARVYGTQGFSAARPPGGDGISCSGTELPDAGQSTVCAFLNEGVVTAFTLFGVQPDNAQTTVLRVRDEISGTS